jgi:hypothetical protein
MKRRNIRLTAQETNLISSSRNWRWLKGPLRLLDARASVLLVTETVCGAVLGGRRIPDQAKSQRDHRNCENNSACID